MVYSSLIPTPPTCCCFILPSHQCSISLLPAFPLTHRTAPGWPPDTQQSRAGPRLLLAGAARPLHRHRVHPAACTSRGPGGGWCLQGWHCMGTMAPSLPCPSPGAGWTHVHPLLAWYPGPEATGHSWVTLSTGTLPPGHPLTALASHCWQRNWQPLPSYLCSPWKEEQGLERFPKCPQLSPRHGGTEIQIRVCCNLNLGKCPAIHSVRRKGKAP